MDRLKITEFADPVCTWCWGTSPITRALEYRYGEQIEISYVMSGMIEDIRTFNNRRLEIGGEDIELSNRNMLKNWLEASKVHGMPVQEHRFHLFNDKYRSTISQCMAYITAKKLLPKKATGEHDYSKAHKYLRRLQEATAAEAMHTTNPDVLVDLAAVEGYEPNLFRDTMESEKVRNAYEEDKILCRHYGVLSTPTFLLEYKMQEVMLQGFTTCETLERNISQITYDKVTPRTTRNDGSKRLTPEKENILSFISRYPSVYPVEIATAFGLERKGGHTALNIESYEHLPDIIEELLKTGCIAMTPQANSFKIYHLSEGHNRTQQREREYAGTF